MLAHDSWAVRFGFVFCPRTWVCAAPFFFTRFSHVASCEILKEFGVTHVGAVVIESGRSGLERSSLRG